MITLVEFFGMPGSGKSTIARIVRKNLEQEGVRTLSRAKIDDWIEDDRLKIASGHGGTSSLIDLPATLRVEWRAMRLAASVQPQSLSHFRRARRLAGWYRRTYYLAHLQAGKLAIQDEGVLQTIRDLVMFGFGYSEERLKNLTACIAEEPHRLFVYVRTDREIVRKRRRERSGLQPDEPARLWRHEEANHYQEQQVQRDLEVLYDRMNDVIEAVASDRKIIVNCDRSAEEAARMVLAFVGRVCR